MATISSENKKRIYECDFIRGICALGIVVYHYFCNNSFGKYFYHYSNGVFGTLIVAIFFMLSGMMLYYNYGVNIGKKDLKIFYYKRWKSIYPMFYIAYLICHITIRGINPYIFLHSKKVALLTIFGLDGYFWYKIPNLYLLGEWFLGAIILLYCMYPLVLKLFNKSVILTFVICFILFLSVIIFDDFFEIDNVTNLLYCLFNFEIGMMLCKYYDKIFYNNKCFLVSLVLSLTLLFIPVPFIENYFIYPVLAFSLFIVLLVLGRKLMSFHFLKKFFMEISSLSYAVFLIQHRVILWLLEIYDPEKFFLVWLWILLDIIVTLILAKLLSLMTNRILKLNIIKKFESKFFL